MFPAHNFKRKEFECKCGCGGDTVDAELLAVLENLRAVVDKPIIINCCFRCPTHNKEVGGAKSSQHLQGRAADIVVRDLDASQVYDILNNLYPNQYGIGKYKTFTHIDTRCEKARW